MAELYHLLQMLFSALLFLISCLGSLGHFLYPWSSNAEHAPQEARSNSELTHLAGNRPLNRVQIEYPPDMLDAHREAKVVLACDVEVTGKTNNCRIIQSSGQKTFDLAALRYVMRSLFSPAMKNGMLVKEYAHQYSVNFKFGQ